MWVCLDGVPFAALPPMHSMAVAHLYTHSTCNVCAFSHMLGVVATESQTDRNRDGVRDRCRDRDRGSLMVHGTMRLGVVWQLICMSICVSVYVYVGEGYVCT